MEVVSLQLALFSYVNHFDSCSILHLARHSFFQLCLTISMLISIDPKQVKYTTLKTNLSKQMLRPQQPAPLSSTH